ncbi:MAG: hypothetical protein U0528_21590 [Anaerolineae bacterium]
MVEYPFDAEWRACLEAHLRYVIEVRDSNNEQSLSEVLETTGFTFEDFQRIRYEVLGDVPEEIATDELGAEATYDVVNVAEMEAEAEALTAESELNAAPSEQSQVEDVATPPDVDLTAEQNLSLDLPIAPEVVEQILEAEPAAEISDVVDAAATDNDNDESDASTSSPSAPPAEPPAQQLSLF